VGGLKFEIIIGCSKFVSAISNITNRRLSSTIDSEPLLLDRHVLSVWKLQPSEYEYAANVYALAIYFIKVLFEI